MHAPRATRQAGHPISPLAAIRRRRRGLQAGNAGSSGYMLLDLVLALTIVLLIAAIAWPMLGRGTGNVQQAAIALDIASLLRADRDAASESGTPTGTLFDVQRRTVTAASGRRVHVPEDIAISVTTGTQCVAGVRRFVIAFAPDGTSCGGVVALSSDAQTYTIRINWLSGLVDVARAPKP